jgi:hypothetical protein
MRWDSAFFPSCCKIKLNNSRVDHSFHFIYLQDRNDFEQLANDCQIILERRKFPKDLQDRIAQYFRMQGGDTVRDEKILSVLSSSLRREVTLYVKRSVITNQLFDGCGRAFVEVD